MRVEREIGGKFGFEDSDSYLCPLDCLAQSHFARTSPGGTPILCEVLFLPMMKGEVRGKTKQGEQEGKTPPKKNSKTGVEFSA